MSHGNGGERRSIKVDYLARVEGEGALDVLLRGGEVESIQLQIFEPPRFFEAMLRGRRHLEAPDITARICGICPVAYQMSACHAIESACGVTVGEPLRSIRRLLYCGEWIESHTLHISMLHAPDFFGVHGAVELAKLDRPAIERALALKKAGNAIVSLIGGREIHPINVRVGGFYALPARARVADLREHLLQARDLAEGTLRWVAGFDFPDFERDYLLLSLKHADEYPFNEGRIVSNRGLDITAQDYDQHVREEHVAYSTALQAELVGQGAFMVGPLARFNLCHEQLPAAIRQAAEDAGLKPGCRNPFKTIIARAVEVLYACHEAVRIIDEAYDAKAAPFVEVPGRAGTGHAVTEAPRGSLYHRYTVDDDGIIQDALIVPPTSQNQKVIEDDLRGILAEHIDEDEDSLRARCERGIRNYDPCISCSTHFLDLRIHRGGSADTKSTEDEGARRDGEA